MDRFKQGDKLVKAQVLEEYDYYPVGTKATIDRCDGGGFPWADVGSDVIIINDLEWELEHLYDSPLHKALR